MKKTTLFLLALASVGCAEKMDSTDLRTSGWRAEFEVIAHGGDSNAGTIAKALFYGGSNVLVLQGEDRVEVTEIKPNGDEETKELRKSADDYIAEFSGTEEDTEYVFSLYRGDDDDDAPNSHVSLPPRLQVKGIENNGTVQDNGQVAISRESDIVLTWDEDHTSDRVNYGIGDSSDCLWGTDKETGQTNSGSITIPSSVFNTKAGKEDATCGASLYVELERVGERDPAYEEGTVRGKQRFWIQFVSTP